MDEHEQMIADCEKRESRLDDFERNFIDSIGRQLAEGRALSPKQVDTLERTWEKATANG